MKPMGEALVITSGKGGVGKSTLAVNLALAQAAAGWKTALIDADTGLRNLDVLLGMENRIVYDLTDVAEGICRLKQALVRHQTYENLSVIAAAQMRDSSSVSPAQMEKIVEKLKAQFDWVFIDCPAGVDRGFRTAIAGADRAVIVTLDDPVSIRDAERVKGLLEKAGFPAPFLACNRVRYAKQKKGETPVWERMAQRLDMQLLGVVPEDEAVYMAAQVGVPVVEGDSSAGAAFLRMARRLRGDDTEIAPFPKKRTFARFLDWMKK